MTYEQALAAAYQRQLNGARAYTLACDYPGTLARYWFEGLQLTRPTT